MPCFFAPALYQGKVFRIISKKFQKPIDKSQNLLYYMFVIITKQQRLQKWRDDMTHKEIAQLLSDRGVRPTAQRVAVYEYLYTHRTHPSVDTVYEALIKEYPSFSRTTVYNSLHALVKAGLVLELALDAEERHYDADTALHGHFHCWGCGEIADFPLDEELVQRLMPKGFVVEGKGIYFSGHCPACCLKNVKN